MCGKLLKPDLIIVNYLELDFPRGPSGKHLENTEDQILFASKNLKKLPNDIPVILTVMPDYSEVMDIAKPLTKTNLLKRETNFKIFDMREYLPMS